MFELGRVTRKTIDGKEWTFGRLERSVVLGWRDWIKEQIGDPFADVLRLIDHVSEADGKEMIREARAVKEQLANFTFGCPLSVKFQGTEVGQAYLMYLVLRPHHPDITPDKAFDLWAKIAEEVPAVLAAANGAPPGNAGALDPKTGTPAHTNPSTGTPSSAA